MDSNGFCRTFNFEKKNTIINLVSKKILKTEKGHIGLESIKFITECVRIFERGNKVFIIITFLRMIIIPYAPIAQMFCANHLKCQ